MLAVALPSFLLSFNSFCNQFQNGIQYIFQYQETEFEAILQLNSKLPLIIQIKNLLIDCDIACTRAIRESSSGKEISI